ncbi:aromatic acid/H+ symport family MFS transporter [Paraburkholderia caribensis]|uniref:aromatic acid/H+ symport family MFS transporter n=1 Tax=Paraburkholderia TaxID=1822464 RepID=UPI001CACD3E4|nr:aromatic acid/H+ symport family MFS transporter [Paraburkholderia caribensis]BEU25590.1 aromatic acid/H+ symport family MFS transporter [Paraburkholderia sp. 22B1P]CAG9262573.1 4-hydroxybenzoate transporter PcaK [Paraburkholderia caribensis]
MTEKPNTLDVQRLIDDGPFTAYQWLVLVLCFLIVATDGFDTAAIGFLAPSIAQEWGIGKAALGPVMSAALLGLAVGALSSGPLADRLGRKKVLVGSVLIFGAFTLASAYSNSLEQLTLLRFLTGIGLGAAMPNATTLMSEYAPARKRSFVVNAMFCGFPIGASIGGAAAALLIPSFGWRSVFIVGGVAPLVLSVLLLAMPESLRFMVVRKWPAERIVRVLRRIAPVLALTSVQFVLTEEPNKGTGSAGAMVLSKRYRTGTVMLWVAFICSLVVYYMLTSWLPTLIRTSGFSVREASIVTAMFPLGGGIGAIIVGWLMDRYNAHRVISATYILTGLFVWMIGRQFGNLPTMALVTFIAGACTGGGQASLPTLAAAFYPTGCRATGVAWMLGLGRIGAVAGALAGGLMLEANFSPSAILSSLAVPALLASFAVEVKRAGSNYANLKELPSQIV